MRAEQTNCYQPIIVTLETKEEAELLYRLLLLERDELPENFPEQLYATSLRMLNVFKEIYDPEQE